jgi:hypothetical protein
VQLVRRAAHQRQRTVQERRIALAEAGEGAGPALELLDRVGVGDDRVVEQAVQLAQVVGHRQDEQLLLGGEVAVDQPARDPHVAGDLLDRGVLHAALVEQRPRCRDQIALARAAAFGRGHSG